MESSGIAPAQGRLETLASFVAPPIVRRIASDPALLERPLPLLDEIPGAVLFADISGFTALTERLAQRGPAGVEALSRVLNAYFSQLIEETRTHGGAVAKFAGDALLALWPDTGGHGHAVLRAAACALELQRSVADFRSDDGSTLALKVSVGAGPLTAAHVGGVYQRRELFIFGPPLAQVGTANALARPGQVVLSAEAHALVRGRVGGSALAGGAIAVQSTSAPAPRMLELPTLTAAAEPALLQYIPAAIRSRLDAGQAGWLAELRRLTVLFVNLGGLEHGAPPERIQEVLAALQREVYRYEGSIKELSADEKGSTLVVTFGLPPVSHEDDPYRGVQAALALRQRITALALPSAIGVTTGRVFCGIVGTPTRREYTIAGAVASVAARLMQAAANGPGILCDETTAAETAGAVDYEALAPMQLKGRDQAVPVFQPTGLRSRQSGAIRLTGSLRAATGSMRAVTGSMRAVTGPLTSSTPAGPAARTPSTADALTGSQPIPPHPKSAVEELDELVGRREERAALADLLEALIAAPDARCLGLLVEGPAGSGKSRLVEDLVARAQARGVRVVAGAGSAVEESTPYFAWRSICRDLLGLDQAADTAEAQRAAVERHLAADPDAARLLPLLNDVLPLGLAENELTAAHAGESRADNTRWLLTRLITAAPTPLIIVVDAAQWLDSASWAALLGASGVGGRVLVVVCSRLPAGSPSDPLMAFAERPDTRRLQLGPLDPADADLLARRRLGAEELAAPLAQLISVKAQGNPLYIEEIAASLLQEGDVEVVEGFCDFVVDRTRSVRFPETLEGIVTARIDRLEPAQQLTLKTASVIGFSFTARLTRDIYPIEAERPRVPEHLEALVRQDLTRRDAAAREPAYEFRETVTQEVAYRQLPFEQRRKLHCRIAEHWEARGAADSPSLYPLLAHHWRHAGEPERAIDYLERAGEAAMRSHASSEAIRCFETAARLAESIGGVDPERRARWWRQLGTARFAMGEHGLAREGMLRALSDCHMPASGGPLRLAARLTATLLRQLLHRLRPTWFFGRATARRNVLLEALLAYEPLTQIYFFGHATVAGLHAAIESVNLAERAGPSEQLARAYTRGVIAAGLAPLHRLARLYERLAFEWGERAGDPWTRAYVLMASGVYRMGAGDFREAEGRFARARQAFDGLADHRRGDECEANMQVLRHLQGRFDEAIQSARALEASGIRRRDTQVEAWGLLGEVRHRLPRGDLDRCSERIDRARRLLDRRQSPLDFASVVEERALRAVMDLRRGQPEAAQVLALEALVLLESRSPATYYTGHVAPAIAEVVFGRIEASGVSARGALWPLVRRVMTQLRRFARVFPLGEPVLYIAQATADRLRGRPARAERALARAVEAAERLGMPFEKGLALGEKARLLAPGHARSEAAARAADLLDGLGAEWSAERVRSLA